MTERKLAAILSADVVGYSRLMAEDETVRRLAAYRTEIKNLVGEPLSSRDWGHDAAYSLDLDSHVLAFAHWGAA